jgi:hypothetical protein
MYKKELYNDGKYSFEYYSVPRKEYSYQLICKLHNLPALFSEWRDFYRCRFEIANKYSEYLLLGMEGTRDQRDKIKDTVLVPIITERECFEMGL